MKSRIFFLTLSLMAVTYLYHDAAGFSETVAPTRKEDSFSVKGVISRTDPVTKTLYVKTESGLELTYHVDDSTQIDAPGNSGGAPDREVLFSKLAVNDAIEINYRYNENYEKIALSVQKQPEKGSVTSKPKV